MYMWNPEVAVDCQAVVCLSISFFRCKIFTAFNRRVDKAIAKGCWSLHTTIHSFITPSYVRVAPGSEGGGIGKSGTAAAEAG